MPTRVRGVVVSESDHSVPVAGIAVEAYDPATGTSQGSADSNANGSVTLTGLDDRTWVLRPISATNVAILPVAETEVQDDIHGQRTTLSAHGAAEIRSLAQFIRDNAFSVYTYGFVPDAAKGVDVATGDGQGVPRHSGPATETIIAWGIDFEVSPTGQDIIIQLEYGSTEDLDTPPTWTEIDRDNLTAGQKSIKFTSGFTNGTIPANRLIQFNIDQVGTTAKGQDGSAWLMVKRPLSA